MCMRLQEADGHATYAFRDSINFEIRCSIGRAIFLSSFAEHIQAPAISCCLMSCSKWCDKESISR